MDIENIIIFRDGYLIENIQKEIEGINKMINDNFRKEQNKNYKLAVITSQTVSSTLRFYSNPN